MQVCRCGLPEGLGIYFLLCGAACEEGAGRGGVMGGHVFGAVPPPHVGLWGHGLCAGAGDGSGGGQGSSRGAVSFKEHGTYVFCVHILQGFYAAFDACFRANVGSPCLFSPPVKEQPLGYLPAGFWLHVPKDKTMHGGTLPGSGDPGEGGNTRGAPRSCWRMGLDCGIPLGRSPDPGSGAGGA